MKNKNTHIKTTIREFLNENDNYIPKQQPYGGFVSHPKSPTKIERANPFMSTNYTKDHFHLKYWGGKFTDEMVGKLINVFTGNDDYEIKETGSMHKQILIDGVEVGAINYGNRLELKLSVITQNENILMKDVFPNEYDEYLKKYS